MLTVDMILKRAMKGRVGLMTAAQAVAGELTSIPSDDSASGDFAAEKELELAVVDASVAIFNNERLADDPATSLKSIKQP